MNTNNKQVNKKISLIKDSFLLLGVFLSSFSSRASGGASGSIETSLCEYGKTVKSALDVVVVIFAFIASFLLLFQYFQGSKYAQSNFVKMVTGLAIYALSSTITNIFIDSTTCDLGGSAAP